MDKSPYNKRGSYHATLHFDHGNVLHYQQGLDQANWDGISVLILLYVSNEKKNVKMFMRLLTQASIIYTTEMQVATFDVA